jgi:hypothetical protein
MPHDAINTLLSKELARTSVAFLERPDGPILFLKCQYDKEMSLGLVRVSRWRLPADTAD